jgi:hypothetical protein
MIAEITGFFLLQSAGKAYKPIFSFPISEEWDAAVLSGLLDLVGRDARQFYLQQ